MLACLSKESIWPKTSHVCKEERDLTNTWRKLDLQISMLAGERDQSGAGKAEVMCSRMGMTPVDFCLFRSVESLTASSLTQSGYFLLSCLRCGKNSVKKQC